ncbi:MAG: hypothetical protein M3Q32_09960, partial [Pseudomonadota bacterium]|nr:hypothetical protein [Pseudomonadota bacterium]
KAAMHTKDRKPWAGNPAAFEVHQTSHLIPLASLAQCEKQHAMFPATRDKFRSHPAWRAA